MAHTPPGQTRERVYRFVRDRLLSGAPPTIREVQQAMGFGAVESARRQLDALVAEGRLVKESGRARGYRLAGGRGEDAGAVPLVGEIQAGDLRTAIENPDGWVVAQSRATRRGADRLFALRVRGDSMIGVGILDGDVVVVREQATAEAGDVVVAMVDDEATVKTLRFRRGRVVLEPANPRYEALVFAPAEVRILGRVVELHRAFP